MQSLVQLVLTAIWEIPGKTSGSVLVHQPWYPKFLDFSVRSYENYAAMKLGVIQRDLFAVRSPRLSFALGLI